MTVSAPKSEVLLAGATGFVGRHLYPALVAAGYSVRCGTRYPEKNQKQHPKRSWVHLDVEDRESIERAMCGCTAAFFLVHSMSQGKGYPEHEARAAQLFSSAAQATNLPRVVYLGGAMPRGRKPSRHLRSRRHTGEILRSGTATIELRAAMIIGNGSASWMMVSDLAERLPAMILPRWLGNTSYPILIDDVVVALLESLLLPDGESKCFELPGAERVTHRSVLNRTANALGLERVMVNVPVLSPRLSSYWIAMVTRVQLSMAQELVEGVRHDLEPAGPLLWDVIDRAPTPLEKSIRVAIADRGGADYPSAQAEERMRALGSSFLSRASHG